MKLDHFAPLAAVAGMVFIAASFAWPQIAERGPGGWTDEKAHRHAQTRAELHAISHTRSHVGRSHSGPEGVTTERIRDLQAQFNAELAELDAARNRGENGGRILWWLGTGLVLVGGVLHLFRRAS
jgi:hypothetical protein